jgi:hypothetical protein
MRRAINRPLRRMHPGKAFGKAARSTAQRVIELPPEAFADATMYLADTLDWLDLWQNDATTIDDLGNDFDTVTDYPFPYL